MSQYLEEIPPDVISPHDSKASVDTPLKHLDTVIALYDFPGTQPSYLPLTLGDTVYVLSKSASGWWDGVLLCEDGELQRGWFPHNYVRSVNYVQPVLNKLKNNKELDSITAANTAANVLIPSFTNLLQKNLLDFDKPTPSSNTRKNSVVSFASSDTSVKSPKRSATPQQTIEHLPTHGQSVSTITSSDLVEPIKFTDIDVAEDMIENYMRINNKMVTWLPKFTSTGDFVFYCEQLDIYCESTPMSSFDPDHIVGFDTPTKQVLDDVSIIPINPNNNRSATGSSSTFDTLKRDSNASTMSQSSSSSYHHFSQPFFAMDYLFYKQPSDLSRWSELGESFNYFLDLTFKALKDHNKQLFSIHFTRLNKVISLVFSASRLTRNDYVDTKYENSIKRKLKRVASSFAQIYVNAILHLNIMHYSKSTTIDGLFSFDITKLNRLSDPESQSSSISTLRQNSNPVNTLNSLSNGQKLTLNKEADFVSYYHQIEIETDRLRTNLNALVKLFIRCTKGKVIKSSDYDGSDASEEEGENRFDMLPQMYPRFLTDEFNGGNWCNPFFVTSNPVLNASGDDLKNKYHQKLIIDHSSYETMLQLAEKMVSLGDQTQKYLDPDVQHLYYNASLTSERNTQILRLIYKYLYHASSFVDLIESFDFTVFCLVKKYSSSSEDDPGNVRDRLKQKDDKIEDSKIPTSNLTFDYPIVLEFFQLKQQFHDFISNIIMSTQALTLEDPDVFKGIKDEDPLFYSRDALKVPTEKAAMLLASILLEQSYLNKGNSISLNSDSLLSTNLTDGVKLIGTIQSIVRRLIDERETILNYATRVLHDDLNVQLLVIERNNTILSEKSDEGHSYYTGGQKKTNDVPWFLEGDEEYDLLLDIKGNIKGGTKEALVAHLTHHDLCDSSFNTTFLITFSTIVTLGEMIVLLINRFDIDAPEGLSYEEYNSWISKKQNPIRLRVLNVMNLIIEKYWTDSYFNELVLKRWNAFSLTNLVQAYPEGKQLSNNLGKLLNNERVFVEREPVVVNSRRPAPLLKASTFPKKLKLLDIENLELARQLTLREFKLYSQITKHSCIAKVWGKKSGLNENIDSITKFIKASNQLTNFVSYMILRKNESRKRAQLIRYFIQVAEKCRQCNNFSSMTAIISALYSSPIHRLKKTWKYVSSDAQSHLQTMNKLMNSSRNFNEYRDVLKFLGSEPCVPFFGVYLSDLTFVYHGNPDYLMNRTRLINFAKRAKTCEIVSGIDRFKTLAYNFHSVSEIQKFLNTWFEKCPNIAEQYQLSLALEPRESTSHSSTIEEKPNSNTPTIIKAKYPKPALRGARVPLPLG